MDHLNKNKLEEFLLPQITSRLNNNHYDFLSLIQLAHNQELFYPQLYWSFFITAINNSFPLSYDHVLENHSSFGLNVVQAGNYFSDSFKHLSLLYIEKKSQTQGIHSTALEFINHKISFALNLGIVLPTEFFTSEYLTEFINEESLHIYKQKNTENLQNHLQKTLPNNHVSHTVKKKV